MVPKAFLDLVQLVQADLKRLREVKKGIAEATVFGNKQASLIATIKYNQGLTTLTRLPRPGDSHCQWM